MSLTAIYVLADDGLLYKDPTLAEELTDYQWFICFDDDDPPELVIRGEKSATDAALLLVAANVPARALPGPAVRSGRHFGTQKFHPASAFWVAFHDPIPARLIVESGGSFTREQARKRPGSFELYDRKNSP